MRIGFGSCGTKFLWLAKTIKLDKQKGKD